MTAKERYDDAFKRLVKAHKEGNLDEVRFTATMLHDYATAVQEEALIDKEDTEDSVPLDPRLRGKA